MYMTIKQMKYDVLIIAYIAYLHKILLHRGYAINQYRLYIRDIKFKASQI